MMRITIYDAHFARDIADVFYDAVHSISDEIYSPDQKRAWAPLPPDYGAWTAWCEEAKPFLAIEDDKLLGFMSLSSGGLIDRAFVRPRAQRRGIGGALVQRIETVAHVLGIPRLHTEASLISRPFFEKHGFCVIQQKSVCRGQIQLTNFSMEKR